MEVEKVVLICYSTVGMTKHRTNMKINAVFMNFMRFDYVIKLIL